MTRPRGRGDALLRRLHAHRMAVGTLIDAVNHRIAFVTASALDAEFRDLLGDDAVDSARDVLVSGSRSRGLHDEPQRRAEDLFLRGQILV